MGAEVKDVKTRGELIFYARRRMSNKLGKELMAIQEQPPEGRDRTSLARALELRVKLDGIRELPPEQLLTPEELVQYNAL